MYRKRFDLKSHPDIQKWNKLFWGFKTLVLSLILLPTLSAQSIQELEQERKKIQADIQLTNQLLQEATDSKAEALSRYITLQKQIDKRESLVKTIEQEINITNKSIARSSEVITVLQDDILALQEEYGDILRSVYRQKMTQGTWFFILSSSSMNEAFRRWRYVKQYDAYRQKQATLIKDTQATLIRKMDKLEEKKAQKQQLINEQTSQMAILSKELDSRNSLYQTLKKDEKRLKAELKERIAARAKLDKALETIIYAATHTPKSAVGASVPSSANATNSAKYISASDFAAWTTDFQQRKGQLPWPVESGIITKSFGEQAHPSIPNIKINNNGIDIKTPKRALAKAIFEGEVAGTQFIPGYQNTVIIKHGEYFSVYSNLEELFVKKGEYIRQGQKIGQVSTNRKSKVTEMHFEVWRNKQRLNPSDWLN